MARHWRSAHIFISYRRSDRPAHALSIGQHLQREFGSESVFMDVERLQSGENFPEMIRQFVSRCAVMVVVIGPDWRGIDATTGLSCLDRPEDWVRKEIAEALRQKIRVMPVLVDDALLPRRESLPDELRALPDLQAREVAISSFRSDVNGLVRDIRALQDTAGHSRRISAVLPTGAIAAALTCVAAFEGGVGRTGDERPAVRPLPAGEIRLATARDARQVASNDPSLSIERLIERGPALLRESGALASEGSHVEIVLRYWPGRGAELAEPPERPFREQPREPGTRFRDCETCPEMVVLPSGDFLMGSATSADSSQRPAHPQRISQPFAIGLSEVTVREYRHFLRMRGRSADDWRCDGWWGSRRHAPEAELVPATCVSWGDALDYVAWLSAKTSHPYRLPTEAEWEYAARAGAWFGLDPLDFCQPGSTTENDQRLVRVSGRPLEAQTPASACERPRWLVDARTLPANAFGIRAMNGNAAEWTWDCYHDSYRDKPPAAERHAHEPWSDAACRPVVGAAEGEAAFMGVVRGGHWRSSLLEQISTARRAMHPRTRVDHVGLRVVRTLH